MLPKLQALVKRHPGVALGKVEIDKYPKIKGQYRVFSVPMILLTIEGKETLREAGNFSLDLMEEKLRRYWNLLFD